MLDHTQSDDLLSVIRTEFDNCIGFAGNDSQLLADQQLAQDYHDHRMKDMDPKDTDGKRLKGFSTIVDSTVADTIAVAHTDIIDIFTREDAFSLEPIGEEDVEAARQETNYLKHIVFQQNEGWREINSALHDALLLKYGVLKFWWDEGRQTVRLGAVKPEQFAWVKDAVSLDDATYCVMRTEARLQELYARGYDVEALRELSAGENLDELDREDYGEDVPSSSAGMFKLVGIHEHYLRNIDEAGSAQIIRVVTDEDNANLLAEPEILDQLPFAVFVPFFTSHALIGDSLADKAISIQRTQTQLLRMLIDSGMRGIHGRPVVAENGADPETINDLLNNIPGAPIKVQSQEGVRILESGALSFDIFNAIELVAAKGEMRTGVIRNAQGLNPDSLHDTATGQLSMLDMSQRRIRMIAKTLAETGMRPLILGLHHLIRTNQTQPVQYRLYNEFQQVNPSLWAERYDMRVQIGSGSQATDKAALGEVISLVKEIVELQGGAGGPIVDLETIYALLQKYLETSPVKGLAQLFKAPEEPEAGSEEAPEMDPVAQAKVQEIMAKTELAKQKLAVETQVAQEEVGLKRERLAFEMQLALQNTQQDFVPGGALHK